MLHTKDQPLTTGAPSTGCLARRRVRGGLRDNTWGFCHGGRARRLRPALRREGVQLDAAVRLRRQTEKETGRLGLGSRTEVWEPMQMWADNVDGRWPGCRACRGGSRARGPGAGRDGGGWYLGGEWGGRGSCGARQVEGTGTDPPRLQPQRPAALCTATSNGRHSRLLTVAAGTGTPPRSVGSAALQEARGPETGRSCREPLKRWPREDEPTRHVLRPPAAWTRWAVVAGAPAGHPGVLWGRGQAPGVPSHRTVASR